MTTADHLRKDVLEFVGTLGQVPTGSPKGFTDGHRLSSLLERSLAEAKTTDVSEPPLLPPLIKHVDKLLSGLVLNSLDAHSLLYYVSLTGHLLYESLRKRTDKELPVPQKFSDSTLNLLSLHLQLLDASAQASPSIFSRCASLAKRLWIYRIPFVVLKALMLATLSSASFKAQKSLALWLGLSVRVSAIKGKDSGNVNLLSEDVQEAIWQYYLDTIVKSKSTVATEYMTSIADFLTSFLTQKRYETELIRASEKLLLRAPEVIIKVLDHTTRCVAFDVSSFFSGKFVDPLIGQLKSTNSQVRDESLSFFETLSSKSSDEACLKKVVDQVSNALLTKGPTPEQRIVYFTALKGLPRIQGLSKHLLESMVKLFAKESNESALSALLSCVAAHANCASATLSPDYIQLINIGVKDPKSGVRILYLQVLESLLFEDIDFGKDATAMLDSLFKLAQNVQASGIALLDPKKETPLLSEAIIAIRTLLRSPLALKTSQSVKALETFLLSRQSFFFNEKLYSKLVSTPDDFDVFTEVLFLAFRSGKVVKASDSPLFGPMAWSVLYAPPASYRSNLKKLQSIVSEESSVEKLQILIQGFQSAFEVLLFEHSRALKPDGGVAWPGPPPRSSNIFGVRVYEALQAILPKPPLSSTRLETLILQMAVILSHSLVSSVVGTDAWVRLAFSIGLVPQELITRDAEAMIKVWLGHTEADAIKGVIIPCQPPAASLFRDATLAAVSLFTDIQPALLCSSVIPWCLDRLSINTLGSLSLEDIRTWMVPEGELFFDPVTQFQKKRDSSHQPKTADEKWEMELRKELKSKGGAKSNKDVKLSKADKDLVTLQMAKETAIRKTVTSVRHDIITAIDLFDAVLRGVNKSIAAEALESFEVHLASVLASVWGNLECLHRISQQQDSKISDPVLNGSKMADLIRNIYKLFRDCPAGLFPDDIFCAVIRAKGLGHCISHAGELTLNMSKDLNVFLTQILSQFEEALDISNQLSAFDFALLFPLLQAIIMKEGDIENFKSQAYTEFALTTSDILMLHCGIDGSASTLSRHAILGSMIVLLKQFPLLHSAGRDSISALLISATDSTYDDDEASTERRAKASTGMMTSLYNTLLSELLTSNEGVRQSCLFGLSHMAAPTTDVKLRDTCIWMLRRDPCEDIQLEAERLWIELYNDSCITKDCIHLLIEMTAHSHHIIRDVAGEALCIALESYPNMVQSSLDALFKLYAVKAEPPVPEFDAYGMVIPESLHKQDEFGARSGIAKALKALDPVIIEKSQIMSLFEFLINGGATGDRNGDVQRLMRDAGLLIIAHHCKPFVKDLLAVFDKYLSQTAQASEMHDRIREGVVLFSGALARHLDQTDPMIPEVIRKLIDTLKTPSESVQMAVSECLPPLLKINKKQAPQLVDELLAQLFASPKFGERKGAAYGLAGVVKGCGVASLRNFNILGRLRDAVEDKKNPVRREGALFAYETMAANLGRIFEPYIIKILPLLLTCFGDSSREVRDATNDTCRTIMSKLSAHCVKLILPSILVGLEDRSWRTKTGSIDVLGSMSFLAPKQLGQSLPTVIPRLSEVLSDTHQKVQEAAKGSLAQFGNIIKNPEIQSLVPILINALVDPNTKIQPALAAVLETSFSHYIDAPSLALLMPILKRSFKERGMDIKIKCGQIIGNLASLTDHSDLIPYLATLRPGLHEILVDPNPEVRAVSAKAFGILIEQLGEPNFPGLVDELLNILKSDSGAVDRSGAAQGLSEVVAGLGKERLEGLLPEIIENASSTRLYVREGFMTLLIYLPVTHGESFTPYLGRIIPSILNGLADESDIVRQAGLKSGQVIVRNYADSAIELLLPELEKGLFHDNWRIRSSSLDLMGDLLFKLAGLTGKQDEDEDEDQDMGTETGRKGLIKALSEERFFEVLASLYMARCDSNAIARQSSLQVWKAIVVNTPKTLKEILPILMSNVVANLASSSLDKRGVAARTLGDLVRKLGDLVLLEIVPVLEESLSSADLGTRQGVCIGITEILGSGREQVSDFALEYVPLVKRALIDPEPEVREAAAKSFDLLYHVIGSKAIDEVLPSLLSDLKQEADTPTGTGGSPSFALSALQEIMQVRGNIVFPTLIPTLLVTPITKFNARALSSLITVAGPSLSKRLGSLLPTLMQGLNQPDDAVQDIQTTLSVLLTHIQGPDSVHHVMTTLFEVVKDGSERDKMSGFVTLKLFFESCKEDSVSGYLSDWIVLLMGLMNGRDGTGVLKSSWGALEALVKRLKKEEMDKFVGVMHRGLVDAEQFVGADETLPGFCLPKGLSPVLPVFLQGLMFGNSDTRETAALALGKLVTRTTLAALKPFVIQITGPLIRVIGDRFNPPVKSAILKTLGLLLTKTPSMLRPFLPQLQRTFVKTLTETDAGVRDTAAKCLSCFIPLQARLDPLVLELVQAVQVTDVDKGVKEAVFEALYGLVKGVVQAKRELSQVSMDGVRDVVLSVYETSQESDDTLRLVASKCAGVYLILAPSDKSASFISLITRETQSPSHTTLHFTILTLTALMSDPSTPSPLLLSVYDRALGLSQTGLTHQKSTISSSAVALTNQIVLLEQYKQFHPFHTLQDSLVRVMMDVDRAGEERRDAVCVIKRVAKFAHEDLTLKTLLEPLMLSVRDRVLPVKLASERALIHVLKVTSDSDGLLHSVLDEIDRDGGLSCGVTVRGVSDYVKRVIRKIADVESDTEES